MPEKVSFILGNDQDRVAFKARLAELKAKNPGANNLLYALMKGDHKDSPSPDRNKQLEVLEKLPVDLTKRMQKFLEHSLSYEQKFYGRTDNYTYSEIRSRVSGELFEELVRRQVSPFFQESEQSEEQVSPLAQLTKEFLSVWQYPLEFGAGRSWRNPDAAFFDIDSQGQIFIKAVGEVKSDGLDGRGYEQLRETGIVSQVKKVIEYLQKKPDEWFDKNNLPVLKAARHNLQVHPDGLQVRLFVPAQNQISEQGITRSEALRLIKVVKHNRKRGEDAIVYTPQKMRDKIPSITARQFINLLVDNAMIFVENAVFSKEELDSMTLQVLKHMGITDPKEEK